MSQFSTAITKVLQHEGGYSNYAEDRGGETLYGLSRKQYPKLDFTTLTKQDAIDIYKRDYWDGYPFDGIADQEIATKVFDMAVNMGHKQAFMLMQRACNETGSRLVIDGKFGLKTLEAVNGSNAQLLLTEIRAQMAYFYCHLIAKDPTQFKWAKGWMRRAVS